MVGISQNKLQEGDDKNKKHPKRNYLVCGAKNNNNEYGFCLQRAGWGTDHLGKGRCKHHGGKSTGPKDKEKLLGNKNARKHGVYESVIRDQLKDDEKETFDKVSADDDLKQELKILRFKLLRLLEPVEQQQIMGNGEIETIEIDEVTKSKAIAKLVDNIRKLVKDNKEINGGDEAEKVDQVVKAMMKAAEGD